MTTNAKKIEKECIQKELPKIRRRVEKTRTEQHTMWENRIIYDRSHPCGCIVLRMMAEFVNTKQANLDDPKDKLVYKEFVEEVDVTNLYPGEAGMEQILYTYERDVCLLKWKRFH